MSPFEQARAGEERKATYRAYLLSPHWQRLKTALLVRCRHRCEACHHDGSLWPLDGHHLIYRRRLEDGVLADLLGLCRRCHDIVHDLAVPILFQFGTPNDVRRARTLLEIRRYLPDLYPLPVKPPAPNYPRLQPGQTPRVHRIPLQRSHPVRSTSHQVAHGVFQPIFVSEAERKALRKLRRSATLTKKDHRALFRLRLRQPT